MSAPFGYASKRLSHEEIPFVGNDVTPAFIANLEASFSRGIEIARNANRLRVDGLSVLAVCVTPNAVEVFARAARFDGLAPFDTFTLGALEGAPVADAILLAVPGVKGSRELVATVRSHVRPGGFILDLQDLCGSLWWSHRERAEAFVRTLEAEK
jgi:hypothetical protein